MADPVDSLAMATQDDQCDFKPIPFKRRPLGENDVLINMKYCGVCHSDLHVAANHFGSVRPTKYPCVPGHELAGVCAQVGAKVTKIAVGDHVGVGCIVDSCLECEPCKTGNEQKCTKQMVGTYNGQSDKFGRAASYPEGSHTYGGYATKMVIHEHFAIRIPKTYPLEAAGPVMCAGVTMYDPLKLQGAKEGTRVGVIGMGGLGVMGVKLAKAMGCKVTAISRGRAKEALATKAGAESFIAVGQKQDMENGANTLDLILNTIPAYHDYSVYQSLLAEGGKQVLLGAHAGMMAAMMTNKCGICCHPPVIISSIIGGIQNTQEVMDLCAKNNIVPELTVVPVTDLNKVYELLDGANDDGVRYVLDIENTLNAETASKCTLPPPKLGDNPCGAGMRQIIGNALWMLMNRSLCCTRAKA